MLATHPATRRAYCRVVMPPPRPRRPNRNSPDFTGSTDVVVDSLPSVLGDLESNRQSGFLLADRCSLDRMSVRCNILNLKGDNVAAAQLAVDGEIEHGKVP